MVQSLWSHALNAPGLSLLSVACTFFFVVEPRYLLARQRVKLTFRLTGCKDWPRPQHMSYCAGPDIMEQICPNRLLCLLRPHFRYAICGINQVVLCCSLKPDIRYVGFGAS